MHIWFFHLLSVPNTAINTGAQALRPIILGTYLEVQLLDRVEIVCLKLFFEEPPYFFSSGCIILYPHRQCTKAPVSAYPYSSCYFKKLFYFYTLGFEE